MRVLYGNVLRNGIILTLILLLPFLLKAQKIKFDLDLQGQQYIGTMNPKWFDQVDLYSNAAEPEDLVGDSGLMTGERFGEMSFSIENNTTGSPEELMVKTRNGWYPIEKLKMQDGNIRLTFDWGYKAPPQSVDLEVLLRAGELLKSETQWNQQDDRQCDDDFELKKWSLYCVLKQASIDVTQDFNHRSFALNQVRQEISKRNPKRKYDHQLMDFNNEEEFEMIRKVILQAIESTEKALSQP